MPPLHSSSRVVLQFLRLVSTPPKQHLPVSCILFLPHSRAATLPEREAFEHSGHGPDMAPMRHLQSSGANGYFPMILKKVSCRASGDIFSLAPISCSLRVFAGVGHGQSSLDGAEFILTTTRSSGIVLVMAVLMEWPTHSCRRM